MNRALILTVLITVVAIALLLACAPDPEPETAGSPLAPVASPRPVPNPFR